MQKKNPLTEIHSAKEEPSHRNTYKKITSEGNCILWLSFASLMKETVLCLVHLPLVAKRAWICTGILSYNLLHPSNTADSNTFQYVPSILKCSFEHFHIGEADSLTLPKDTQMNLGQEIVPAT